MKPDAEPRPAESHELDDSYPALTYAWYVVGVLMVIYVLSFIDRMILSLMVEPVKADLNVTDRHLGWLMGPAFAIFYTLFGIPLGWLADRASRRGIIAVGITIWSFMTACCGLARQYLQLAVFRVGVGIGEAALSPAAYSIITDYFPRRLLATAISVYGMGIYIGSGLAYLVGGLVISYAKGQGEITIPIVGEVRPWQVVFLLVGIPGLLLTAMLLTVREPLRRSHQAGGASQAARQHATLGQVISYIWANRAAFFCHNFGFALLAFVGYAGINWVPSFFIRIHGWDQREVGIYYGLVMMTFGSAGIVFGGRLADWLGRKGYADAKLRCGLISAIVIVPFGIFYPLAPNGTAAIVSLAILTFGLAMPFGCAPAGMQEIVPKTMRGQSGAVYLFVVNLFGQAPAPLIAAQLTELVFEPMYPGDQSAIRYSLLTINVVGAVLAIALLYMGLKPYRRTLQYLKDWESVPQPAAN